MENSSVSLSCSPLVLVRYFEMKIQSLEQRETDLSVGVLQLHLGTLPWPWLSLPFLNSIVIYREEQLKSKPRFHQLPHLSHNCRKLGSFVVCHNIPKPPHVDRNKYTCPHAQLAKRGPQFLAFCCGDFFFLLRKELFEEQFNEKIPSACFSIILLFNPL